MSFFEEKQELIALVLSTPMKMNLHFITNGFVVFIVAVMNKHNYTEAIL